MPFSSLRFGQFCDFRPKVCFFASRSKRLEILPFSSVSLTPSIYISPLSQGHFCQLKGQFGLSLYLKRQSTPEKDCIAL
ncbi:hypothetical protein HanXRQr2_Chr15g0673051 [Helianthus annuus]|uniref:Uncharacterized protein n=1 Tax=Helianthus annuus TaxID=4232 RepID=A0A9K3H191_HELAN|nr:hypothetical protein HanXRQr2_Chr15g0673051 [Helianthus annuus]KAJ0829628.1 hypothetical protein HanPSC8_Chr15g0645981 [Helianthus annuus]